MPFECGVHEMNRCGYGAERAWRGVHVVDDGLECVAKRGACRMKRECGHSKK
jgi:hypothetical protein